MKNRNILILSNFGILLVDINNYMVANGCQSIIELQALDMGKILGYRI